MSLLRVSHSPISVVSCAGEMARDVEGRGRGGCNDPCSASQVYFRNQSIVTSLVHVVVARDTCYNKPLLINGRSKALL
jgi:hypothetical protein